MIIHDDLVDDLCDASISYDNMIKFLEKYKPQTEWLPILSTTFTKEEWDAIFGEEGIEKEPQNE